MRASTDWGDWFIYGKPEYVKKLSKRGGANFLQLFGVLIVCCKFFDEKDVLQEIVPTIRLKKDEVENNIPLGKCLITNDCNKNYIGKIFVDNRHSQIIIKLENGGKFKYLKDFNISLDKIVLSENANTKFESSLPKIPNRELNRWERVQNLDKYSRRYSAHLPIKSQWQVDNVKKFTGYDFEQSDDIIGMEYSVDDMGMYWNHILDLVLRIEISIYDIKKLLKYYDSSKHSVSEIIEDFLRRALNYADLDKIMSRNSRHNRITYKSQYSDKTKIEFETAYSC